MNPFPALSNTWKPLMNSSAVPAGFHPSGLLRIWRNWSYETGTSASFFAPLLASSPVSWSRLSVLCACLRSAQRGGAYRWLPLAVRGRRLRPELGSGPKTAVVRRGTLVGLGLCRVCRRAQRLRGILSVSWMPERNGRAGGESEQCDIPALLAYASVRLRVEPLAGLTMSYAC